MLELRAGTTASERPYTPRDIRKHPVQSTGAHTFPDPLYSWRIPMVLTVPTAVEDTRLPFNLYVTSQFGFMTALRA